MNEKTKIILIADDVKLFQIFLKQSLTDDDYELLFVRTGKEALDTVMRKNVDLLILDLELPDINGVEVLRRIRQITYDMQSVVQLDNLPVIMVTAYPQKEAEIEAKRLGVVNFLPKPIEKKEIKRIVKETLQSQKEQYLKRKLILCVDSEPRVQKFYEGVLETEKYNVTCVSNGLEALEAVEFKNPDLIIIELNLPEMSGLEFLQALKESKKDIPVIVVTSTIDKKTREEVDKIGVYKYIAKPFRLEELKKVLNKF
ncbi:response regulator [Candidatus Aerophobetes bacterium]|nr:response regulator [Candidatus Aerophobetes bacterium]